MRIGRVVVHGEPSEPGIDPGALARRLAAALGPRVLHEGRAGGLFSGPTRRQARALAACAVRNPRRPFEPFEPAEADILREMGGGGRTAIGSEPGGIVCYDGFEMLRIAASMVPARDAADPLAFHVVLTDRLPCTYDPDGMRYHGRALVAANPSLISTTGMVEAPARPRRYYVEMMAMRAAGAGGDEAAAGAAHAGAFLERGDRRLAEAAYGYALQAAAHIVTGEAFCADRDCRLYNAHWQADLLHSQLRPGSGLCRAHLAAFAEHAERADRAPARAAGTA